jgi:hypothetical protein
VKLFNLTFIEIVEFVKEKGTINHFELGYRFGILNMADNKIYKNNGKENFEVKKEIVYKLLYLQT